MYIKFWGRMKADVRLGLCPTALVLQQSGLDAQVGDHVLISLKSPLNDTRRLAVDASPDSDRLFADFKAI